MYIYYENFGFQVLGTAGLLCLFCWTTCSAGPPWQACLVILNQHSWCCILIHSSLMHIHSTLPVLPTASLSNSPYPSMCLCIF